MSRICNQFLFGWQALKEFLTVGEKLDFSPTLYSSQAGKTWIVTGSTSGIGFLAAEQLARLGANVWLVGRDETKLKDCIAVIKQSVPHADLDFFVADFMDLDSVRHGAADFLDTTSRLNGIIHNAGHMGLEPLYSKQGYEAHFAVNCLAPWLLQTLLDPILIKSSDSIPGRIVWVSSLTHWGAPYSGAEFAADPTRSGEGQQRYFSSKAINVMQSIQWTQLHPTANVKSLSLHPGVNKTKMTRAFKGFSAWILSKTAWDAKYGAAVELAAAVGDFADNAYLVPWGKVGRVRKDIAKAGASPQFGAWLDAATTEYTF